MIIQVVVSGPAVIHISDWPRGETTLFEALMRKRELDTFGVDDVTHCDPSLLSRLAGKVKRLRLWFDDPVDPDRWAEFGNAVTASPTLERLKLVGHVPRTAFPTHLPVNMHTFKVDCTSESMLSHDWLYHDYWPKKMLSLKLCCVKESEDALNLDSPRTLSRLRSLESLQLYTGWKDVAETVTCVLSEENQIERIGMKTRWSESLYESLTCRHAYMKRLTLKSDAFTRECEKEIREMVRRRTRVHDLTIISERYSHVTYADWFHVMQVLFSVREVPRISACSHAKMLPLKDIMPQIVATLGWPLSEVTW
jgi:hypothetical protein